MALRALQGFFECNISPGFLLITGAWYRTNEHANRSLFWQSSQGFFSIVCNLILYGIARHVAAYGGIEPWRCISLFLGSLTLVGTGFSWYVLGTPNEVSWLSEEEKRMALEPPLFTRIVGIADRSKDCASNREPDRRGWHRPEMVMGSGPRVLHGSSGLLRVLQHVLGLHP